MVRRKNFNISWFLLLVSVFVLCFATGFWVGVRYEKLDLVRVIDGDTFVVKNRRDGNEWRVRLWGVDAPELKECFHDQATEVLVDRLRNKKITYKRYGYDSYGRILAEVSVNGESLEEYLISVGAVRAYGADEVHDKLKPDKEYTLRLFTLEEVARKEKIGMWSEGCKESR